MTILEYLLSGPRRLMLLYEILEAFQLKIVHTNLGKRFEIVRTDQ